MGKELNASTRIVTTGMLLFPVDFTSLKPLKDYATRGHYYRMVKLSWQPGTISMLTVSSVGYTYTVYVNEIGRL